VLSFPLSKTSGEIFINPHKARADARAFQKRYNNFIGLLFVHGLLHLFGMRHGKKMEDKERSILRKFKL